MLKKEDRNIFSRLETVRGQKTSCNKRHPQCGKTYIVQKFARENYESVVYMNFILEPDNKSAFTGNIDVDTIILNLSALIQAVVSLRGKPASSLTRFKSVRKQGLP